MTSEYLKWLLQEHARELTGRLDAIAESIEARRQAALRQQFETRVEMWRVAKDLLKSGPLGECVVWYRARSKAAPEVQDRLVLALRCVAARMSLTEWIETYSPEEWLAENGHRGGEDE